MGKEVCQYHENNVDEVVPNLWLGDIQSSYDKHFLISNNISYIIRVMPKFDKTKMFSHIKYLHIPVKDKQLCGYNLNPFFDNISDFIKDAYRSQKGILVHCKRGHHRSASIIAAFMMKHLGLNYYKTVRYINHLRPCSLRRETCVGHALYQYHLYLTNKQPCSSHCFKLGLRNVCSCKY